MAGVDIDHDMQPSSDTEPETDGSQENPALSFPSFSSSARFELCIYEKVMQAINDLENCSIETSQQDTSTETYIVAQVSIIIEFLQGFSTLHDGQCYSEPVISVYKRLVHISFVHRLFDLRQKYRLARKTSILAKTADVYWADIALAYLGLASVALASGDPPEEWNAATEDSIGNHRRDNCIFAAVQLPESWSSILSVITSHSTSPAAKTLALRLLFTVYVTGKHLNHYDPWIYDSIDPTNLAATCLEVLHQRGSGAYSMQDTCNIDAQGAVHCSMLISLFVIARQSLETHDHLDLIRPHSLGLLLELIQGVMTYDLQEPIHHVSNPRETLNPALNILMRCSNILPWCWHLWADHRIANFECVIYLTATWLFHWDASSLFELDSGEHFGLFIQTYPETSLRIFLQVLHDSTDFLKEHWDRAFNNRSFLVVLGKTCWGISRVMESNSDVDSYVPSLCSCVLKIFMHLHSSAISEALVVKEMILRSLIHIDDHIFRTQLSRVLAEMPSLMQHMAENVISKTKWESRGKTIENDLTLTRITLNFLAICWHKKSELCILRGTVSTLLNLVADLASTSCSAGSTLFAELASGLLTVLSIIAARPELAIHMSAERRETLWGLVIQDSRRRLLVAGSFANYIVTIKINYDVLRCAEAWDYFSSIFLTIMQRDLVEEEDLGILVSPSVCLALMKLLGISDLLCMDSASSRLLQELMAVFKLNSSRTLRGR